MDQAQAPIAAATTSTAVTARSPTPTAPPLGHQLESPSEAQPAAAPARPELSKPEKSPLQAAWPPSAQLATWFLLGVVATLLTMQVLASTRDGARPAERDPPRVDLNHATLAELQQLPGVGPKLAARIDEHRRTRGPFRRVEELRNVPGIGPALLERLRPYVTVTAVPRDPDRDVDRPDPRPEPPPKRASPPRKGPKAGLSKKELALQGVVINVNTASHKDLQRLPYIGAKKAQSIIDARALAPFKTVEDLRRVPGIGPKTLERLRPYVTVGGGAAPAVSSDKP
jgi:competence protein ComEA